MSNDRLSALHRALSWPIAKRSLLTMLIVGSFLNLINQGDALMRPDAINWWKVLLTYCVPFCVATFGAYSAYRPAASKTRM
ncbi:MAG: nitrate/nitrite transporter NrtS [Hyphomicrobiaceae bacterium]